MRWAYLFISTLLLAACAPVHESADPFQEPIAAAIAYLHSEFNPDLQLIRESPITAPDVHWLATDNWLAAHALAAAGEDEFAEKISESIAGYGMDLNGLIEALDGEEIGWPPLTENQFEMDAPGVWIEERSTGLSMEDWDEYVDLRMYCAIRYVNGQKDLCDAEELYLATVAEFHEDGLGFRDKAVLGQGSADADSDLYATYKLALTLYVGALLGEPTDQAILQALLTKQAESGGFTTLYPADGSPSVSDTNTETTSYALLALATLADSGRH